MKIKKILSVAAVLSAPRVVVALVGVTFVFVPEVPKKVPKPLADSTTATSNTASPVVSTQLPAAPANSTILVPLHSAQGTNTVASPSGANFGSSHAHSGSATNTVQ